MKKHLLKILVLLFGISAIIAACLIRFGLPDETETATLDVSTMFSDTLDIAELSTAEFRYRGIAEIYEDEAKTKIRCRACYNAVVKAGVDAKKIHLEVDESTKNVYVTLPDIEMKVTIIDEQSMALLPSDADVGIDSLLKYSKEDVETEAQGSDELMRTAQANMRSTIEGLMYPVLKAQGYTLLWK